MKNNFFKCFVLIAVSTIMFLFQRVSAQIYNYDPIRHNNFETNPSFLASNKNIFTSSLIHQGSFFSSNKFYSDALKISYCSPKYFTGFGLIVNNTHINDSTQYSYIAIGAAYRTILFNKIYTRIGFMYKLINVRSEPGSFTYYSFEKTGISETKQKLIDNTNISVSFSSAREKYYLSFGILNSQFTKRPQDAVTFFPEYYFLNIGDFGKILGAENLEVSYTVLTKKYFHQQISPLSHYLSVLYSGFHITRNSSLRYGARIGLTDNEYIQCDPVISFYHRTHRRKFIVYQVLYNLEFPIKTNKSPFKPTAQFNLTYLF